MGLQVRLRHALGERVLELPERGVDDPVIVGRAGGADVQIPSINVGQRHLVLFVHEGRWIAQNGPDSTGTSVNGAPLPAARVLQGGDVLKLGSETNAPTIEVDAVGLDMPAMQSGMAARPMGAPSSGAGRPPAPLPPQPVRMPPPGGHAPPVYPPAVTAPVYEQPVYEQPVQAVDDGTGWMTAGGSAAPRSYSSPKRRQSPVTIIFGVVLTLAILAGGGAFIYYVQKQKTLPQVVTVIQPAVVPATSKPSTRIVVAVKPEPPPPEKGPPPPPDVTDVLPKPKETARHATTSRTDPTNTSPPDVPDSPLAEKDGGAEPMSPDAAKAFKRVESAYWNTDPAKCLLAIDSFEAEFPGVEKPKLEQYREDMLDKAWWLRIDSLLDKQKDLQNAIKKTQQDIKDETEAAFRKTVLEPRLEDQKVRLVKVGEKLAKEMNYKLTTAPPIGEEAKLKDLRAKRDAAIYDAWKTRILKYLRDNHGSYPWANEK